MKELVVISAWRHGRLIVACLPWREMPSWPTATQTPRTAPSLNLKSSGEPSGATRPPDSGLCRGCGKCSELCRFGAVMADCPHAATGRVTDDPITCEGCGVCAWFCPTGHR